MRELRLILTGFECFLNYLRNKRELIFVCDSFSSAYAVAVLPLDAAEEDKLPVVVW